VDKHWGDSEGIIIEREVTWSEKATWRNVPRHQHGGRKGVVAGVVLQHRRISERFCVPVAVLQLVDEILHLCVMLIRECQDVLHLHFAHHLIAVNL